MRACYATFLVIVQVNRCVFNFDLNRIQQNAGMLILVLKDSLRTFFKSLSLSLGSGPCPCPGPCGSGPCPYPGPCGLVLVLVFSPCKDLFPLFHYSDLFAYHCSVNAYN